MLDCEAFCVGSTQTICYYFAEMYDAESSSKTGWRQPCFPY